MINSVESNSEAILQAFHNAICLMSIRNRYLSTRQRNNIGDIRKGKRKKKIAHMTDDREKMFDVC